MEMVLQNIAGSYSGLNVVFRDYFLSESGSASKGVANEGQVSKKV